ncbi:autotransporter outer membrane beta-barrel domain-containing protein [Achromobacter xylosoxidans]|nr:autotransporter outer membrane beta-barrel domain-containing protein [Achromobacter xylosoxidans]
MIDPAPPSPDPVPPVIDPAPPSPDPVPPEAGGGAPSGSIRFADLLGGRNAIAAANAIDGLPDGHDLYRHALNLPEGAPQAFFSALAGELHASVRHALPGLDATIRNVPLAHLRANLSAGLRPGEPIAAVGLSDAAPAASTLPVSRARPVWAQLIGNWQRQDATDDTTAVRLRTTGLFVGADHALGAGWRLGGALGYTDSQLRTKGTADRGGIDSYSALAYGGKAFEAGPGTLNLMLGASHTWHDIDTRRRVAVGGLDQTLRAGYRANTTQVFTELGYTLAPGSGLTLEPYAGLAWAGLRSRAFQESGGSAALSGTRQATRTTTATLGLRAAQSLQMGPLQGSVTAGAGWRRAFGDLRPTSTLAFDTGSAFTVTGAPIARNAALLEAGLQAQAGRNATVALNYAGQIGAGSRDHSATLSWRWTF